MLHKKHKLEDLDLGFISREVLATDFKERAIGYCPAVAAFLVGITMKDARKARQIDFFWRFFCHGRAIVVRGKN
jgi:hypothetical protein